jgi:hypothetical protein
MWYPAEEIQDQTRRSTDWESFLAQNSGGQAIKLRSAVFHSIKRSFHAARQANQSPTKTESQTHQPESSCSAGAYARSAPARDRHACRCPGKGHQNFARSCSVAAPEGPASHHAKESSSRSDRNEGEVIAERSAG